MDHCTEAAANCRVIKQGTELLGERFVVVHFEDLMDRPRETLAELARIAGLTADREQMDSAAAMLDHGRRERSPGRSNPGRERSDTYPAEEQNYLPHLTGSFVRHRREHIRIRVGRSRRSVLGAHFPLSARGSDATTRETA